MAQNVGGYFRLSYTSKFCLHKEVFPVPKAADLLGEVFSCLTVESFAGSFEVESGEKRRYWRCRCKCGNLVLHTTKDLRSGRYKSCGCKRVEFASTLNKRHGKTGTKVYRTWKGIKSRCLNTKSHAYKDYGGRGISIAPEWKDNFEAFYAEIGDPPSDNHSIDRIDNERGYEPGNVRWVASGIQNNNKRNNVFYEYKGKQYQLKDLSEMSGIPFSTLASRLITLGWGVAEAIETPVVDTKEDPVIEYEGKQYTIYNLAKERGVPYYRLRSRILAGWSIGKALSEPAKETNVGNLYEFDGQRKTMAEWAKISGISLYTISARINRYGWDFEKAITTPVKGRPETGLRRVAN
jgi:hypothetical protein